jgi:hypothetical protein
MRLFSITILSLIIIFVTSCSNTPGNSNLIEIEQILDKPSAFVNKNSLIHGVVNQVKSNKQLFSVISQKEFKECGIADCNANEQLPVRYQGALPQVGETIEIVGIVKQSEEGFVYEAGSIRNLENL